MTFEARDSAAKIVPARFRKTFPEKAMHKEEDPGIRHMSAQTKWDSPGIYDRTGNDREINRKALTSAFIKFSKTLQTSVDSSVEYYDQRGGGQPLIKCPSAPSLVPEFSREDKKHSGEFKVSHKIKYIYLILDFRDQKINDDYMQVWRHHGY